MMTNVVFSIIIAILCCIVWYLWAELNGEINALRFLIENNANSIDELTTKLSVISANLERSVDFNVNYMTGCEKTFSYLQESVHTNAVRLDNLFDYFTSEESARNEVDKLKLFTYSWVETFEHKLSQMEKPLTKETSGCFEPKDELPDPERVESVLTGVADIMNEDGNSLKPLPEVFVDGTVVGVPPWHQTYRRVFGDDPIPSGIAVVAEPYEDSDDISFGEDPMRVG